MAPTEAELQMMAQQLRKPAGKPVDEVSAKMDKVNEPLFDLTLDTMQPDDGDRILEIGFGTGAYLDRLFDKADGLEVHGIDHSEAMVKRAEKNNPNLVDEQLHLETGDSANLPYEDNSFDKIFNNMVIYFWDEPEPHLAEVHRVLKPDGKFYTGLRTKKSMELFPFTQYNFNLFTPEAWITLLQKNRLPLVIENKKTDPVIEMDMGEIRLESVCIAGRKV